MGKKAKIHNYCHFDEWSRYHEKEEYNIVETLKQTGILQEEFFMIR